MAAMDAVLDRTASGAGAVCSMTVLTASGDVACICHEHNPRCLCLPRVASPPLAPAFTPSRAQRRFMALHTHLVVKWQWHWFNTMLRATTDRGDTATLWADDVEQLIREGLMEAGMGFCMTLTARGREVLDEWRNK